MRLGFHRNFQQSACPYLHDFATDMKTTISCLSVNKQTTYLHIAYKKLKQMIYSNSQNNVHNFTKNYTHVTQAHKGTRLSLSMLYIQMENQYTPYQKNIFLLYQKILPACIENNYKFSVNVMFSLTNIRPISFKN